MSSGWPEQGPEEGTTPAPGSIEGRGQPSQFRPAPDHALWWAKDGGTADPGDRVGEAPICQSLKPIEERQCL